jgi:hypothetical protein
VFSSQSVPGCYKQGQQSVESVDGIPAPRQTGRLSVGRKLTSTSVESVGLLVSERIS